MSSPQKDAKDPKAIKETKEGSARPAKSSKKNDFKDNNTNNAQMSNDQSTKLASQSTKDSIDASKKAAPLKKNTKKASNKSKSSSANSPDKKQRLPSYKVNVRKLPPKYFSKEQFDEVISKINDANASQHFPALSSPSASNSSLPVSDIRVEHIIDGKIRYRVALIVISHIDTDDMVQSQARTTELLWIRVHQKHSRIVEVSTNVSIDRAVHRR